MKSKAGDTVTWTSSANGTTKSKTGKVAACVPAHESAWEACSLAGVAGGHLPDTSSQDRYIVEVPRARTRMVNGGGRIDRTPKVYGPGAALVDKQMDPAQRKAEATP